MDTGAAFPPAEVAEYGIDVMTPAVMLRPEPSGSWPSMEATESRFE